jgi:hypothetical protein
VAERRRTNTSCALTRTAVPGRNATAKSSKTQEGQNDAAFRAVDLSAGRKAPYFVYAFKEAGVRASGAIILHVIVAFCRPCYAYAYARKRYKVVYRLTEQ